CKESVDYKYVIELPDGNTRSIQGLKISGSYLYSISVVHGRYMDTICAREGASTTSHYHDATHQSGALARVVARSNYTFALASGGVSYVNATYSSASVSEAQGSRLAFRGNIKWASSVNNFRSISV
ncbi:MAG: hypothetical protein IKA41_01035, partial [Bacteroidaceae bacterium]|nr:hypothetical protein [Bacteroidaceae bacterium]